MKKSNDRKSTNPDPITNEPGAHPVGTGIGALGGGAATGAAVGTVAGPVGTAVGAAAGAIIGGLAGKGVAESVNPTQVNRVIGYEVQDPNGDDVGTVSSAWTDERDEPVFLGVKTGWLLGRTHVVPVHTTQVNDSRRVIKLPYSKAQIKEAPSFDADAELDSSDIRAIHAYYGVADEGSWETSPETLRSEATSTSARATETDETTVPIREEHLKVGKRQVEGGAVRIRRVVRTETVNQPVQLDREDVVIERVPASEVRTTGDALIEEKDIFIPLRREEAVVQKTVETTGAVRVRKTQTAETREVTEQVRKEDVEVDRDSITQRRSV